MKVKNVILLVIGMSLLVTMATLAKDKGDVDQPQNLGYVLNPGDLYAEPDPIPATIAFDWDDVADAEKYSLDIEGIIVVDGTTGTDPDPIPVEDVELEIELSFSSDISELTLDLQELHAALYAAIDAAIAEAEINDAQWEVVELYAKVKGLDPHDKTDTKSQDNPFSESVSLLPHPEL